MAPLLPPSISPSPPSYTSGSGGALIIVFMLINICAPSLPSFLPTSVGAWRAFLLTAWEVAREHEVLGY